ncbi:MAG TPA: heparan-alpha-glucosaminide N-acetyltransferase domain-containing protein, partial [Anaerovoracaceae bacterium]|nr:heparan-alpha-glucosaminide N-acetyltransferase domain-containing protein [Anaerovoracaceae bacterium]
LSNFAIAVYYPMLLRNIGWWIAVFCFIFICGISCSFSQSNLKRGLRLGAVAVILSLATYGIDRYLGQENVLTIRFGVLHMLASSILIYCLIKDVGITYKLFLSFITIGAGLYFINAPMNSTISYSNILAHSTSAFYSADYFPLMPWFGFFLLGASLGPVLYPDRRSFYAKTRRVNWDRPILFVGRNSLLFYVIHQPAVYVILYTAGLILVR